MSIAFLRSAPLASQKHRDSQVAIFGGVRAGNVILITTRERQDDAGNSIGGRKRGGAGRHGWAGAGGRYHHVI